MLREQAIHAIMAIAYVSNLLWASFLGLLWQLLHKTQSILFLLNPRIDIKKLEMFKSKAHLSLLPDHRNESSYIFGIGDLNCS